MRISLRKELRQQIIIFCEHPLGFLFQYQNLINMNRIKKQYWMRSPNHRISDLIYCQSCKNHIQNQLQYDNSEHIVDIHSQMLFRNSISFFRLARAKKPNLNNRQKPGNLNNKQKQIPDDIKQVLRYRQQLKNMQVSSQVLRNNQQIKRFIQNHRNKLQQLDQLSKSSFISNLLKAIAGLNILGFGTSLAFGKYYTGIWVAGVLHPSFLISSALLIGYHAAILIMKNALKLDITDSQLRQMQDLELFKSTLNVWLNTGLIIMQSGLLIYIWNDLMIDCSLQTTIAYCILGFSLVYRAKNIVPSQMVKTTMRIKNASIALCLIFGLYAIACLASSPSFKQGIQEVFKRYKLKKLHIQKGPINIQTTEVQTQQ